MKTMELVLDDLDYEAIQRVMAIRQRCCIFPDGESNVAGKVLAEICRGWEEFMHMREDEP